MFGAAAAWVAGSVTAIAALATHHHMLGAIALGVTGMSALAIRLLLQHSDRDDSALADGIEAVGVAAVAMTIAATNQSPTIIGAAAAIAFAAVVQQYAALVFIQLVKTARSQLRAPFVRHAPPLLAPLGAGAVVGLAVFLALDGPAWLLVVLACWIVLESLWSSVLRGIAIAFGERRTQSPILPRRTGRARWHRLGEGLAAARDPAFWGLVVARPLARVALQVVAEQRWITPNRITAASIVAGFGAAAAIATGGSVALALSLIFVRSILDSVDGQLARYRDCGSSFGSYLDKVSDLFCWGALCGALAIRAYAETGRTAMLGLPLVAALVLALQGFALWLVRLLVPSASEPTAPTPLGVRAWAKSLWRIVLCEEPDLYLWIALALLTARYDVFVPLIAGAYAARALLIGISRARAAARTIAKETPA